jgi:hypothetical protein
VAQSSAAYIPVFDDHSVVRARLASFVGRRSETSMKALVPLLGAIVAMCVLCGGCRSKTDKAAEVKITRVPDASPGGPERLDYIEGNVRNAKPGQHIVLYAHSGLWWVQPVASQTTTSILPDGSWKNSTHLGTEYAALLVDKDYVPPARTAVLPAVGSGVLAVVTVAGKPATPVAQKIIHFSGYDWTVRTAGSDRGGESDAYDPANVWTDKRGFLHLRTAERDGRWTCAEVSLPRSLGYGTYKFVIQDSAHLPPSAVVGFLTFDDIHPEDFAKEIDIELSRWGDPKRTNAHYVIQPYYVPENVFPFESPAGPVTHSFHWESGKVTFESGKGAAQGVNEHSFASHVFSSGIPAPSSETVRINLYDFLHAQHPSQPPAEVVIEKFEYLP